MTFQTLLYFTSILLTCVLTGFLAWYAWRQPPQPGVRAYAWLALDECLLALMEILSIVSGTQDQALFWFKLRFIFSATIPVFWFIFTMEYSGRKDWLSKRLLAGSFILPLILQVILWSNSWHGLWVKQEVAFHQDGPFWIAETSARIPGIGFMVYSFYGILLILAGSGVILFIAWRSWQQYRRQMLLVTAGMLISLAVSLIPVFNLLPQAAFNPFLPGIGISALLYALAIFRFDFLKRAPAEGSAAQLTNLAPLEKRSLALFIFSFILFASGLAAASYLTYQNYEKQFRAQIQSQLSSIAELKVNELVSWRKERLADAEMLYQNTAFAERVAQYFENPSDAQAQKQLRAWLDKTQVYGQYERVFLLDIEGRERIAAPDGSKTPSDYLNKQAASTLASGQITQVDFYRDTPDGSILLALLVPIFAEQEPNHPLGILVLRIDPQVYLDPFIQRWPVPSASAETLLVRREVGQAVYLNSLRFQSDTALNLRFSLDETQLPAVKAALGQTGVVEGLDYRGVPVVADIRAVPGSPWFLVSKMDTAEVYAPLRERLWQTILFFGVLILAAGAGLTVAWRQQRMNFYRGQVEAADALRASEEKFRLAFDTSPDSVAITRLSDGMFVSVNKGFEQISGYPRAQVVGKSSLEINIWKDPADRRKVVEGLRATGAVRNYEATFLTREGEIYGLMSAVIIELNGEPHILNITRDISERKQAEEKLHESEERFRRAVLGAPFPILIHAEDGEVVTVNTPWSKLTGYEHSDIPTIAEWTQKAYGTRMELVRADIDKLYALDGPKAEGEYTIMTRSGQARIWDFSSAPIGQLPDGRRLVISMAMDITERKQAEEALRESEDKFKHVFDYAVTGNSLTLPSGEINVNRAFCEMLGYSQEELKGGKWQEISHPDDVALTQDIVKSLLSGEKETARFTKRYLHKNGSIVWAELGTALRRDKDGKPLYFMTSVNDITARRQAEEKLKKAMDDLTHSNAELERFAYVASHDLQEPLRMVTSYLQLLERRYKDKLDGNALEFINYAVDGSTRMKALINDLLAYSRVSTRNKEVALSDCEEALANVLNNLQVSIEENKAKVTHDPLPKLMADKTQLESLFQNLIGNAIKFHGSQPPLIHVGVNKHEKNWVFSVSDNGIGIDPQYFERIFIIFQRLHNREDYPGTGIGLAISKRIVERHGGRMWIESRPEKGSTFFFTLPIRGESQ